MESIPDKIYFTIGEVARLARVKAHVLRFWEQEFPALAPKKDSAGRRVYRKRDVDMVMEIRSLLYSRKFTIAGARQYMMDKEATASPQPAEEVDLRKELEFVLSLLKEV